MTPYTSKGTVEYKAADNEIIVSSTSAALFQTGEQVTVTAVYQDGTNVQQVARALTISSAATLADISFGALQTSNTALKDKRVDITNMSSGTYYKEVTAKDQYENVLTASKLNGMLYSSSQPTGTLFATPSQADGAYVYLTGFDTTTDKKVIAKYNIGSLKMPGTQTFTYTAVGGYTATDSIEVVDDSYIATLNVEVPELYGGKEAEIIVTATDEYGDTVDLYNVTEAATIDQTALTSSADYTFKGQNSLTKTQAKITVPAGMKLKVTKNTSRKTVKFTLTAKDNTGTTNVQYVLLAQSATPTINNIQCVVQPNAGVYGIAAALKSGGTSITVKNGATTNLNENIVILDQYGSAMGTLKELVSAAKVVVDSSKTVESTTQNSGGHSVGDFVVNITKKGASLVAAASNGAGEYTVTLWKIGKTDDGAAGSKNDKLAERTFTVIESDATYVSYAASVAAGEELLYVGTVQDTAAIVVKGTDAKGNTVTLTKTTDYTLTVDNADLLEIDGTNANVKASSSGASAAKAAEPGSIKGSATVTVWDTKGNEVATVTVDYSNATPVATSVYAAKSTDSGSTYSAYADTEITLTTDFQSAKEVTTGTLADAVIKDGTTWYALGIHDQYGLPFAGQKASLGGQNLSNSTETIAKGATKTLKITGGSLSQTWSIVNGSGSAINLTPVATTKAVTVGTNDALAATAETTVTWSSMAGAGDATLKLQVSDTLAGDYTDVNGVTWSVTGGAGAATGTFDSSATDVQATATLTRGKYYRIVAVASDGDSFSDVETTGAQFEYIDKTDVGVTLTSVGESDGAVAGTIDYTAAENTVVTLPTVTLRTA